MKKSLFSSAICIVATAILGIASAWAHHGPDANDAYTGDARDHVVTHRWGCVRTSEWNSGMAIKGCEGTGEEMTYTLGAGALFNHNKTEILPKGKRELRALAAKLRKMTAVHSLTIIGHTDSTGSDAYNKDLSMRRARAVRDYLVNRGVKAEHIRIKGMGESRPVADNGTAAGRAKNRRVVVKVRATGN